MNRKEVWTTTYRGVPIKICKWFMRRSENHLVPVWNYYLLIREESVPNEYKSRVFLKGTWEKLFGGQPRLSYDYSDSGVFCSLDWHGGITYYEIKGGINRSPRIAKAGCDYNHLWDEGRESEYCEEFVLADAKRTVDELREVIPSLLVRCMYFGTWHKEDDGVFGEEGEFMSNAGLAEQEKSRKKMQVKVG